MKQITTSTSEKFSRLAGGKVVHHTQVQSGAFRKILKASRKIEIRQGGKKIISSFMKGEY